MLAQQPRQNELVVIADPTLLISRAAQLNLPLSLRECDFSKPASADAAGTLCIHSIETSEPVSAGELNSANADYVLQTLRFAVHGCMERQFAAMLTAPVHKGVINDAGVAFMGHTEFIANITGGYPVMMLLSDTLRVSLATTHIPVSEIAGTLNQQLLIKVINVLHADLQHKFALPNPRILVCGLNPHAGEGGHLGREEIEVIEPALAQCRTAGIDVVGPLPADTLFTPRHLSGADAVLAMYHDQGLPVLKYAGFGSAVNLTLGLPIVRTSVDHGTAIDLAGTGKIDDGSIRAALALAEQLGQRSGSARAES